jgi:hypothetical protein
MNDDIVHMIIEDDLYPHEHSENCPCDPEIYAHGQLIIHRAYDGRDIADDYLFKYGVEIPILMLSDTYQLLP